MQLSLRDILETTGGGAFTWLWTAAARHMPEWPLTWGKAYEWLRATVQEVANQRSGGAPPNPIYPALRGPEQPTH